MMSDKNHPPGLPPLDSLLETLAQLISQARAYERVLPPDNYPARAAGAVLSELAGSEAMRGVEVLGRGHSGMTTLHGNRLEATGIYATNNEH